MEACPTPVRTRSSATGLESLGIPIRHCRDLGPCLISCWAQVLPVFPSVAIEPSGVPSHPGLTAFAFLSTCKQQKESQLWHLSLEPCFSRPFAGPGSPGSRPQRLIGVNMSICTKLLCAGQRCSLGVCEKGQPLPVMTTTILVVLV